APICDANACRGCRSDDECTSRVCSLDTGTCVAQSNILYAAPPGALGDCSLSAPCTLANAITMLGAGKTTIRMLPGTYPSEIAIAPGVTAAVVGTGAMLTGSVSPADMVTTDVNSNLSIRGLTIMSTAVRRGVFCNINLNGTSTLSMTDVDVEAASGGESVSTFGCHLALTRTRTLGGLTGQNDSAIVVDRSDLGSINLGPGKG